jgi:hypothetical protein
MNYSTQLILIFARLSFVPNSHENYLRSEDWLLIMNLLYLTLPSKVFCRVFTIKIKQNNSKLHKVNNIAF